MSVEAATDGDVFLDYLEHVRCPRLKPGQLVVMDNLGAHKVDGVRERIEQTGASLLPAALFTRFQPDRKVLGPDETEAS